MGVVNLKLFLKSLRRKAHRLGSFFKDCSKSCSTPSTHLTVEALEDRTVPTVFEVGTGLVYQTLSSVPWGQLAGGDTVNIHYKVGGYHELVLLSTRGTATAPIRINGIAGPQGEKPVIDGQNATLSASMKYAYQGTATSPGTPNRGLLVIGPAQGYKWGFKPGYIEISGLEFRGANASNTFTDSTRATRSFTHNAAGIFVERGEHITVSNCTIDSNGNGLFVASGDSEEVQSRDITVRGNDIFGNGNIGRDREHNVYTEAIGVTFEYNHFGPLKTGAIGNNVKDRSAGTVFRYNWVEGGAHLLDLVNPQESAQQAVLDPSFKSTLVYGNVFVNGPGSANASMLIHYGGDDGIHSNYRTGTLYFYNNTVINQANQTGTGGRWRTTLFRLDTPLQIVDARNNVIYSGAATLGAVATEFNLLSTAGTAVFGTNWISPGWIPSRSDFLLNGSVSGTGNFITNTANNPGFMNLTGSDYRLASGSQSLDAAGALHSAVANTFPVMRQYAVPAGAARNVIGSKMDLGAFESSAGSGGGGGSGGANGSSGTGPAGQLQFGDASYSASAQWKTSLTIPVTRRVGSFGIVKVDYELRSGDGVNSAPVRGTLTFKDGAYTAPITLKLTSGRADARRTYTLVLLNPTNGAVLGTQSWVTLFIDGGVAS